MWGNNQNFPWLNLCKTHASQQSRGIRGKLFRDIALWREKTAKPCQLNVLRWLASPSSRNRFSNALPKMAPIKEPQSVAQKGAQNCCPKCAQKVNPILPKIKNNWKLIHNFTILYLLFKNCISFLNTFWALFGQVLGKFWAIQLHFVAGNYLWDGRRWCKYGKWCDLWCICA